MKEKSPVQRIWELGEADHCAAAGRRNGVQHLCAMACGGIVLLAKLPKLPLGTVVDTASGKLKQIIVDQVDSMETTLAHLFPEMTANITAPVLTLTYLFVLD